MALFPIEKSLLQWGVGAFMCSALVGCASAPPAPPLEPFRLELSEQFGSALRLNDARELASLKTRRTDEGFFAGDELLQPSPNRYVAQVLEQAISQHQTNQAIRQWLADKQLSLRVFEVLVELPTASVPFRPGLVNLPAGQAAGIAFLDRLGAESGRTTRVVIRVEIAVSGDVFSGEGRGPYVAADSRGAVSAPAGAAIGQVVAGFAWAAAGLRPTAQ
jgi:hypothetical protein